MMANDASRTLGIGVIGYGNMGRNHCQRLKPIAQMKVAGIFDVNELRCELARADKLKVYGSFEHLLYDKNIDVVIIATPNDTHKKLAIDALEAGKHVICEKPVTLSVNDFDEICRAADEKHLLFVVHQNRRWDEDYQAVRKIISDDTLGEVYNIESRVHGSRGIPGDWRHTKEHGGGMLYDWGVHLLDQLCLLSDERIISIYAELTHISEIDVDDGFRAIIKFSNGLSALVEVATSNYISLPRWYINGREGTAINRNWSLNGEIVCLVDNTKNESQPVVTASGITKTMAPRNDNSTKTLDLPKVDVSSDFYSNVYDVIVNGKEPIVRSAEVRRVLSLIEAIYESDRCGQIISCNI